MGAPAPSATARTRRDRAPGARIPMQYQVSPSFRALKKRSAALLAAATRRVRRSTIVAGSFFRTLRAKLLAVPSIASGPSATASGEPAAVREVRYLREDMPGDIVALRLLDSERSTIDTWYEECTALMSGWARDQRLRYLHDVRHAESLKPHSIDRVTKILKGVGRSDVRNGRGAILLNNATVAATLNGVVRHYIGNQWQIRCFSDEAEALRWLSE
jgi:hypothetical protein